MEDKRQDGVLSDAATCARLKKRVQFPFFLKTVLIRELLNVQKYLF